ncbi:MAG: hypothetical protein IPG68_02390 [Micrococcales bacterium]|nr:hypothetical protein [Micrococcales bacterium]
MKKIAIPAVLAVAGSVLVATPASADSASGATLTWKISECAFDATIASCGSITEAQSLTGNVTKGGEGWAFTGGTGPTTPRPGPPRSTSPVLSPSATSTVAITRSRSPTPRWW